MSKIKANNISNIIKRVKNEILNSEFVNIKYKN